MGKAAGTKKKILVADISHTVRVLIKKFLEDEYEVVEAESGKEIFSILEKLHGCDSHCVEGSEKERDKSSALKRNASCDLKDLEMILLCMELPDCHAFDVTLKIREKFHEKCLPIILNTSNNKREIIMEAIEKGINDFIVKPFPQELLLSKIKKLEKDIPVHDQKMSELISKIPFFRGVPESQVAYILNTCSEKVLKKKGESVCSQDEMNFDLFILMEGQCGVLYNDRKVAEINPIDTIGEMGFIGEQRRSATVQALEPSEIIVIKKEPLDGYLNEERAISEIICKNIILSLNERIRKSNEMVKKLKIMAEEYLSL